MTLISTLDVSTIFIDVMSFCFIWFHLIWFDLIQSRSIWYSCERLSWNLCLSISGQSWRPWRNPPNRGKTCCSVDVCRIPTNPLRQCAHCFPSEQQELLRLDAVELELRWRHSEQCGQQMGRGRVKSWNAIGYYNHFKWCCWREIFGCAAVIFDFLRPFFSAMAFCLR
jgi:hypothetical protein